MIDTTTNMNLSEVIYDTPSSERAIEHCTSRVEILPPSQPQHSSLVLPQIVTELSEDAPKDEIGGLPEDAVLANESNFLLRWSQRFQELGEVRLTRAEFLSYGATLVTAVTLACTSGLVRPLQFLSGIRRASADGGADAPPLFILNNAEHYRAMLLQDVRLFGWPQWVKYIPDIIPGNQIFQGRVANTEGSPLRIRSSRSRESAILASLPEGHPLEIVTPAYLSSGFSDYILVRVPVGISGQQITDQAVVATGTPQAHFYGFAHKAYLAGAYSEIPGQYTIYEGELGNSVEINLDPLDQNVHYGRRERADSTSEGKVHHYYADFLWCHAQGFGGHVAIPWDTIQHNGSQYRRIDFQLVAPSVLPSLSYMIQYIDINLRPATPYSDYLITFTCFLEGNSGYAPKRAVGFYVRT